MQHNILGKTGIEVSELCYGALPIGPLQANFTVPKAAEVIRYCLEQGINFSAMKHMNIFKPPCGDTISR